MIRLGKRLAAIASLVREGAVLADVGTDHALLACFLVQSGRCSKAFATDINPMPLSGAEEAIRENGLSGEVETVLTDGLNGLEGCGITDIVIAGMGGELIATILERADWAKDGKLSFVLQPMTRPEVLRFSLGEMGWEILCEVPVEEGEHAYTVIRAAYTGQQYAPTLGEAWCGPYLECRNPAGDAYLRKQRCRLQKMLRGIPDGTPLREEYLGLITKMESEL